MKDISPCCCGSWIYRVTHNKMSPCCARWPPRHWSSVWWGRRLGCGAHKCQHLHRAAAFRRCAAGMLPRHGDPPKAPGSSQHAGVLTTRSTWYWVRGTDLSSPWLSSQKMRTANKTVALWWECIKIIPMVLVGWAKNTCFWCATGLR